MTTKGGVGVKNTHKFDHVVYGWPLDWSFSPFFRLVSTQQRKPWPVVGSMYKTFSRVVFATLLSCRHVQQPHFSVFYSKIKHIRFTSTGELFTPVIMTEIHVKGIIDFTPKYCRFLKKGAFFFPASGATSQWLLQNWIFRLFSKFLTRFDPKVNYICFD